MNVHRPQRNYGCRIHDQGTYLGMRTIVRENDLVRVYDVSGSDHPQSMKVCYNEGSVAAYSAPELPLFSRGVQ